MSRAIDRLVAEKVMGWEWIESLCCWCPTHKDATLAETRSKREWLPSTSIACAWEVVEKMRDGNRKVSMETIFAGGKLHNDVVVSGSIADLASIGCADEETMPFAICIAALHAVGVDAATIEAARNQP